MSAHRARHRTPAPRPAAPRRSARELIDRLGCASAEEGQASPQCLTGDGLVARQARHRVDASLTTVMPRQSTLTVLALSAVGAATAMTGEFPVIHASDAGEGQQAAHPPLDDVLVSATTAMSADRPAVKSTGPSTARSTGAHTAAAVVHSRPDPTAHSATAAVLAEDPHQANAREIAALARSVELEQPRTHAESASERSSGVSSALPAGLGVRGLDLAPGAAMRATALSAAMDKIGVPYVWGAAGPSAFDCSGLVLWAFKRVGISLPHSAAAQSRMGRPVAKGDLRPGDLVFFYSPVSHVGMYIGNGKVVHASEPGKPVKISSLSRMPFHNARRL